MESLNGDIVVMRNGRSTSQVSVYNYPEHLNPFYEDDQHKRLRFWKISKKDNEGRRNSFSIANLKEIWAFKSFRTKKKSSTLGINKTSESPPLLRRNYELDNSWNTFDHRLRASNTSSINSDSFQRNATYRSSLQTLPTSSERIGLNRNDGYRSTIQVTRSNPRYQQLQQQNMGVSHNRRSSQSSMVSTNPFESDDDENEDINTSGMSSVTNGSMTTLTSRTPRKKRRAPAPPTPIHGRSNGVSPLPIIRIEPSQDNTPDELRIEEHLDIANLTAEIESFVKTKSNDDVEIRHNDEDQTATKTSTTKLLDRKEKVEVEKKSSEATPAPPTDISRNATMAEGIDTTPNAKTNAPVKANRQVTTEIVTIVTTTKRTAGVTEPVEKEINMVQVPNEIETKIDDSKEIKANGAIPKKQSNNNSIASSSIVQHVQQQSAPVAAELCIKETYTEELPQKPVPLKRQTKPETEVGQVECIHVHVESPKTTPRKDYHSGLSSFKTTETAEVTDTITVKTPFVLASPPIQKRSHTQTEKTEPVIKETVKFMGGTTTPNKRANELNITEEGIKAKPEVLAKPTLSPKPVTKEPNGKIRGFAEIHKPMRKNNQNGHVRNSQDGSSISPPIVPQLETKENEKKINKTVNAKTNGSNGEATTNIEAADSLKIVETRTSIGRNRAEEKVNDCEASVTTTLANHNEEQKRDNEFDLLYRPKPGSQMEWKHSTLAPLETNIPPEKRKSVKDIIESINRSQRLLNAAANKDFTVLQNQNQNQNATAKRQSTNNNNLNENLKILNETQREIDRLVEAAAQSTDADEDVSAAASSPSPSPSNYNNECSEAQKLDNNEIFQKCKVKKEVYDYRETSPITSNLDWNPVPKPKRTKPGYE